MCKLMTTIHPHYKGRIQTAARPSLEPPDAPFDIPTYLGSSWLEDPDAEDEDETLSIPCTCLTDDFSESLLSWTEDATDKASSHQIARYLEEVEDCLYEGVPIPGRPDLTEECRDWGFIFPHLRVRGKQIFAGQHEGIAYLQTDNFDHGADLTNQDTLEKGEKSDVSLRIDGKRIFPLPAPAKRRGSRSSARSRELDYEEIMVQNGKYEEMIAYDSDKSVSSPDVIEKDENLTNDFKKKVKLKQVYSAPPKLTIADNFTSRIAIQHESSMTSSRSSKEDDGDLGWQSTTATDQPEISSSDHSSDVAYVTPDRITRKHSDSKSTVLPKIEWSDFFSTASSAKTIRSNPTNSGKSILQSGRSYSLSTGQPTKQVLRSANTVNPHQSSSQDLPLKISSSKESMPSISEKTSRAE